MKTLRYALISSDAFLSVGLSKLIWHVQLFCLQRTNDGHQTQSAKISHGTKQGQYLHTYPHKIKPYHTIPYHTKPYHTKLNNTFIFVTHSFFNLEDPHFSWKYIWIVPTHYAMQNQTIPYYTKPNNTKMVITRSFFKLELQNFAWSTYIQYAYIIPFKTKPYRTKPNLYFI